MSHCVKCNSILDDYEIKICVACLERKPNVTGIMRELSERNSRNRFRKAYGQCERKSCPRCHRWGSVWMDIDSNIPKGKKGSHILRCSQCGLALDMAEEK